MKSSKPETPYELLQRQQSTVYAGKPVVQHVLLLLIAASRAYIPPALNPFQKSRLERTKQTDAAVEVPLAAAPVRVTSVCITIRTQIQDHRQPEMHNPGVLIDQKKEAY